MIVDAYFDESGHPTAGDTFVIGGLAGPSEYWADFDEQWLAALKSHGIDEFHMNEFENRKGAFADWPEAKKRDLLGVLIGVIRDRPVIPFGSSLQLEKWNALPEAWRKHFVDPYLLTLQVTVQKLAEISRSKEEDHAIDFTFDKKDEFRAKAEFAFGRLKKTESLPGHLRIGKLAFGDRRVTPRLQAADLVAYELRKDELNTALGSPRPVRWPMTQLASKLVYGRMDIAYEPPGSTADELGESSPEPLP